MPEQYQGRLVNVTEVTAGSELADTLASGETSVILYDASDFDEEGGTLQIGTEIIVYTDVDMEQDSLTLAVGPTGNYDTDEQVFVYPPTAEKEAMVQLDGEEEPVLCRVPHNLLGVIEDAVRDGVDRESVLVELQGSEYVLVDVLADEYRMSGYVIDPGGLPDSDPEEPPATSPTFMVKGGPTAIIIRVLDQFSPSTTLEFHMHLTDPLFVPTAGDPATLVLETNARVAIIDHEVDDTPLLEGQTYYLSVIAKNSAGAAQPSPVVAAQLDMAAVIDAMFREIVVGFILAGTIEVGDIKISTEGDTPGIYIGQPNNGFIWLPLDSNIPARFNGDVETNNLTSKDRLDIYKLAQLFGTLRLINGMTDPAIAPTFSTEWDNWTGAGGAFTAYNCGLVDGNGTYRVTATNVYGGSVFAVLDASNGAQISACPMPANFYPTSLTKLGSTFYVLGSLGTPSGSEPWVYPFTHSGTWGAGPGGGESFVLGTPWRCTPPTGGGYTFNKYVEWDSAGHYAVTDVKRPALGNDGTNLLFARQHKYGGAVRTVVRTFVPSTGAEASGAKVLAPYFSSAQDMYGIFLGAMDFAASRYVSVTDDYFVVYSTTSISGGQNQRVTADDWLKGIGAGKNRGAMWDGTRFWSLDSAGVYWKYVSGHVNASTIFARYTWYDGVGTTHETGRSPSAAGTWFGRAKLRVTTQPAPEAASSAVDAAKLVNIYAGTNDTTNCKKQHVSDLPLNQNWYTIETLNTTGAVAPTSTTFSATGTTPGRIESTKQDATPENIWWAQGDGTARLGDLRIDTDGHHNPVGSTYGSIGIARSTAISVANTTWTGLAANFTGWTTSAFYGTPSGYVQVSQAGFYEVLCSAWWTAASPAADANRRRLLRIYVGSVLAVQTGTEVTRVEIPAFASNEPSFQIHCFVTLSANDYIIPQVYQSQGAALNINNCAVTVRKIG